MKIVTLSVMILSCLYSCNCSKTCNAFNRDYLEWMPYVPFDTLNYINDLGDAIQFVVMDSSVSGSYDFSCGQSWASCHCVSEYQCESTASTTAMSNSSRDSFSSLQITLLSRDRNTNYDSVRSLSYTVFDFNNQFTFAPTLKVNYTDSLIDSMNIGGTVYKNVIESERDTTLRYYLYRKVWKVYYNKRYGIIGFFDRQTHSFFHRQ